MKYAFLLFILTGILFGAYYVVSDRQASDTSSQNKSMSSLSATEQKASTADCTGTPTPSQAEGPYYTPGSPERNDISDSLPGEKLTVTGIVFNSNCEPVANAWLDFWQADANGNYDNEGFILRGHQYTDENGMYRLETIMPAEYGTRPPHIHVKVRNGDGPVLTSQLYFPDRTQNLRDTLFNQDLIMEINDTIDGKTGIFHFVLPR